MLLTKVYNCIDTILSGIILPLLLMNLKLANLIILVLISTCGFGQERRIALDGIVQRDAIPLQNVKILNLSSNDETTSFKNGYFNIDVKLGDTLLLSALNNISRKVLISNSHIDNKTIKVYLEEGFNELDEVMIIEKFRLDFGELSLPEGVVLDNDSISSKSAPNMLKVTDPTQSNSNVNFRALMQGLGKLIWKKRIAEKKEFEKIKTSKLNFLDSIAPQYKTFFTKDLDIDPSKIYEFIDYCQDRGLDDLYERDAIEVMNFFVLQSRNFNAIKP